MRRTSRCKYILGIDEVGRGPLAGDVYVGAVILPTDLNKKLSAAYRSPRRGARNGFPCRLADSKKLLPHQREAWAVWMRRHGIFYAIARISPTVIDRINIVRACNLAAGRAYQRVRAGSGMSGALCVVADGGLSVGDFLCPGDWFDHFPKADERVPAVSLASIIAKVLRDRAMVRLARRYPQYGFDVHKGYGTSRHLKALRIYGAVPVVHRKTFIRRVRVH